MLCLEVTRNNQRLCLAGSAQGSWDLSLMWSNPAFGSTTLYVGGVNTDEPMATVEWVREDLAIGEPITFRMVEADDPDTPQMSTLVPDPAMESNDIRVARNEYRQLIDRMQVLEKRWGMGVKEPQDA